MSTRRPACADLVIVGGGMVGVTLALLLADRLPDLQVVLLEASPLPVFEAGQALPFTPGFDVRNTALSRRTVQAFTDLGLWPQLAPHATPIHRIHVSDRGRFGMARLDAGSEQVDSFGQVIENAWLGVVLLAALRQRPQVQVWDGVMVTALRTTPEAAQLTWQQGDDTGTLQAPLMIAADGTGSRSRDWLGLGARWHDYAQTALVTTVATSLPHGQEAFERFTPDGPIALLPLPDRAAADGEAAAPAGTRRSLVWAMAPDTAEGLASATDRDFLAALQSAFGGRAGRFQRVGRRQTYPLRLMVADRQVRPRAVILGNAAHSLHPVAGQGFNLCLRDALVLVETLAQAVARGDDLGALGPLQAYEQSRLADQGQIIRFSDSLVRGFGLTHPLLAHLRSAGLLAFDLLPGAKPTLARYAMGLSHV